MKKFIVSLCCTLLLSAQLMFAQAGQTGFSFLKIGVGSRALSMGDASVAAASDPSAVYYNPAALSLSDAPSVLLMHQEWIQGAHTDFLGAATSAGAFHFGLGIASAAVDDIEVRTTPGPALSTFSSRNASIGISGAYDVSPELSLGATGKLLYEKIFLDDASGLAVDLGAVFRVDSSLSLGTSLANLGSVSPLRDEASKLPTILRIGGAYTTPLPALESAVMVSADFVSMSGEGRSHVHAGGEATFREMFSLRAGYQSGYEARSVSFGMGVRQGMFRFDYAFLPFSLDLGSTHTLSLLVRF